MLKKLVLLFFSFLLLFPAALSNADGITATPVEETDGQRLLRGWDDASDSYVYISFGRYPQTRKGDVLPCLWRVLHVENNEAFLLNEYIIDFYPLHSDHNNTRYYNELMIFDYLNTTMLDTMVNTDEKNAIRHTDELGYLFLLDTKQAMTREYGFRPIKTQPSKERECAPTAWAMTRPKAYRDKTGKTWYWTRETRPLAHEGYQWILGYDGHISMAGFLRTGGIRPAMYIDTGMLHDATGDGTEENPYVFSLSR